MLDRFPKAFRWMFNSCSIDVLQISDTCSIEVQQMFDRCSLIFPQLSIDGQQMFERWLIGIKSIFAGCPIHSIGVSSLLFVLSTEVRQIVGRCSNDFPIDAQPACGRCSIGDRYVFDRSSIDLRSMGDRFSADVRWAFHRCSIAHRSMFDRQSIHVRSMFDRDSMGVRSVFSGCSRDD